MKTRLLGAAAVLCLSTISVLNGHPAQAQNTGQLTPYYGHRSGELTPEQQARMEQYAQQQAQMCRAAAVALHAGDYAQAEADARQDVALGDGRGEELLAGAMDAQGRDQEALQEYRVIVVDQKGMYPRNLLPYALLLLKAGQWAQAVAAYNAALPDLAEGGLMRASSHFSPASPGPAALATAIHIARGLTYNASVDFARQNQDDLALAEYQKALQSAPASDLANFYYGYGLQKLGRTSQASAAFTKTIKMAKGTVKAAAEQALEKQKKPA